jgi:hypothetical protein
LTKAANAVQGFTGEGGKLTAQLRARNIFSIINVDEPSFDIRLLFSLLAQSDLQLALSAANNFTGEPARATTTLAIARSILDKQKSTTYAKTHNF